jgi:hypothetical protein
LAPLLAADLEPPEPDDDDPDFFAALFVVPLFDFPPPLYPSANQPPPLSTNAEREIIFSSFPRQLGQRRRGGSPIFWMTSSTLPHFVQLYS